jgi:hypothetical protein
MWKRIENWGGVFKGKIMKEKPGWFTDNVDDTQIILNDQAVKELFPLFEQAYKLGKPFRFNIRGNLRLTIKRLNSKQLVIRASGNSVSKDYSPDKINSAKDSYFEIYIDWKTLPSKLKEFMEQEVVE